MNKDLAVGEQLSFNTIGISPENHNKSTMSRRSKASRK